MHPTIYIPSYNRPETIKTHLYLTEAVDYKIVVHSHEEQQRYLRNATIPPERLVVSGMPLGLCQNRQWILDHSKMGEWVLMMDDNIDHVTALEMPWYDYQEVAAKSDKRFARRFDAVLPACLGWPVETGMGSVAASYQPPVLALKTLHGSLSTQPPQNVQKEQKTRDLLAYVQADTGVADSIGARLIGYSPTNNYYFRTHHYATIGYVIGKMIVVKKSHLNYDFNLLSIDDHEFTAQNLLAFGTVLVNHFMHPVALHFAPGGLGTKPERLRKRLQDVAYIMAKYPGLYRYKANKDMHPQEDVALRFYSHEKLTSWRKSMGVLK